MKIYYIGLAQKEQHEKNGNVLSYKIAVSSSAILDDGGLSFEECIRISTQNNYHRVRLEEISRIIDTFPLQASTSERRCREVLGIYVKDDLLKGSWNSGDVLDACDNDWQFEDGKKYPDADLWSSILKKISAANIVLKILGNSYFVGVAESRANEYLSKTHGGKEYCSLRTTASQT